MRDARRYTRRAGSVEVGGSASTTGMRILQLFTIQ
jgi:hypothetical protein